MALHYDGEVRIVKVNMGPFNNNGYIVSCPETNEGILIDTPAEPELLLNEVGDVSIKAILITHNHQDHLLGFDEITGSLDAPVGITTADKGPLPKAPDVELTDGQVIPFGNQELRRCWSPPATPTAQAASWSATTCSPATPSSPVAPARAAAPRPWQPSLRAYAPSCSPCPTTCRSTPATATTTTIVEAKRRHAVYASKVAPRRPVRRHRLAGKLNLQAPIFPPPSGGGLGPCP